MERPTFQSRFGYGWQRERYFLEPEPDLIFIKAIIIVLNILGITALVFFIWAGQKVVMSQNAISQMLGAAPTNLLELRLTGLLLGVPPGILAAVPLFSLAQLTDLIIRVERNTRLTKELTYYLLTEGKIGPPK